MQFQETKQIISEAKNIYIIPEEILNPEAITSALALFYTLKELGKNVNLIIENFPEDLNFLTPSLDFISYPKNFVISIPNKIANVSQIYYEKNDDDLKIHLTVEKGAVKKDDISFYFSETKPDLIITLGIKDYQEQLKNKLNSFGFLLDSPILNIDNSQDNRKFGKINLIDNLSLTEIVLNLIKDICNNPNKDTSNCLLAGLMVYTDNFKNFNVTADVFETAGYLMKKGGDFNTAKENFHKTFNIETI
jgi:nanoRNase/pAp phosphatase (c-di-AMP/oligoRNAs hydrolase)